MRSALQRLWPSLGEHRSAEQRREGAIVRTLVTTELAGTIDMRRATADDFGHAQIVPDEFSRAGTAVELRVPVAVDR